MNSIFNVDFTLQPDGPLYNNRPRPNIYWARDFIYPGETVAQFVFSSPTIEGGAVKQVLGDTTHRLVTAFARDESGVYLPTYPGFVPPWNPGIVYADAGELVITFTLPALASYPATGDYIESIALGCHGGLPGSMQPGFSIGLDSYTSLPTMKCRFVANVTSATISQTPAATPLVFGGGINTAKLAWDRSSTQWIVNGSTVYNRSGYDRSFRYPFFAVNGSARVLSISASTLAYVPPDTVQGFWRNIKNAYEV